MNKKFDFDLDDPLADILSSNSNDSFYDDSNFDRKNSLKKSISKNDTEPKNMSFQNDPKTITTEIQNEQFSKKALNIVDTSSKTILHESQLETQLKELDFNEEQSLSKIQPNQQSYSYMSPKLKISEKVSKKDFTSDYLDDLGLGEFEKKPSVKFVNVTSEMFDDILGDNVMKKTVSASSPLKKAPNLSDKQSHISSTVTGKVHSTSDMKQPTAKLSADLKFNQPVVSTLPESESPSHIKNTKSITNKRLKTNIDWLGLDETSDSVELDQIRDVDVELPAWLMGKDTKKQNRIAQPKLNLSTNIENSKMAVLVSEEGGSTLKQRKEQQNLKSAESSHETQSVEQLYQPIDAKMSSISSLGLINAGSCSVAQEGANMYIQEQESQLMVALQLKAQEEKLLMLQNRQHEQRRIQMEVDRGHTSQLEQMLSKQAEQRRLMQGIIMKHQDSVNQKIRALLGHTSSNDDTEGDDSNEPIKDIDESDTAKKTIDVKMTERKQLMQLILTLQENHDREMELMENSYRRQLSYANLTVTEMEDRLKEDNERLYKFYGEKCLWMEQQCKEYVQRADGQLTFFAARHQGELQRLQQQQTSIVEILQQQHTKLLENIRETLQQEQRVINDATNYSTMLTALKVDIEGNTGTCAAVLSELRTTLMSHQQQSSASLTKKEELVTGLLESLNTEKEMFLKEKADSAESRKLLESGLRQMTQAIDEENSNMKQRRMEFEFEKATFKKQTEFAKSILEKQQDEMKMIREKLDSEYEEMQTKLEEGRKQADKENSTLAIEKRNMENSKREIEKIKNDLNRQLEEVANEKAQLSSEKQKLHADELTNITRSNELESLTRRAMEKQMQADRKMSEADFIVKKYEDKLRKIQEQVISLNTREKQIARDKTSLSRERLSLYNERRELETRQQCSLCRASQTQSSQLLNHHIYGGTVDEIYAKNHHEILNLNTSVTRDGYSKNDVGSLERQMEEIFVGHNFVPIDIERGNRNYDEDAEKPAESQAYFGDSRVNAKEVVDPRLLMLKLDVQQVIKNLNRSAETKPSHSGI